MRQLPNVKHGGATMVGHGDGGGGAGSLSMEAMPSVVGASGDGGEGNGGGLMNSAWQYEQSMEFGRPRKNELRISL